MPDRKASEVDAAIRRLDSLILDPHPGLATWCSFYSGAKESLIAAVRAEQQGGLFPCFDDDCTEPHILAHDHGGQQGGHVANCRCCAAPVGCIEHKTPYRDPRCGESIELIKAKARLEVLQRVSGIALGEQFRMMQQARAAVEKLESKTK